MDEIGNPICHMARHRIRHLVIVPRRTEIHVVYGGIGDVGSQDTNVCDDRHLGHGLVRPFLHRVIPSQSISSSRIRDRHIGQLLQAHLWIVHIKVRYVNVGGVKVLYLSNFRHVNVGRVDVAGIQIRSDGEIRYVCLNNVQIGRDRVVADICLVGDLVGGYLVIDYIRLIHREVGRVGVVEVVRLVNSQVRRDGDVVDVRLVNVLVRHDVPVHYIGRDADEGHLPVRSQGPPEVRCADAP